MVKLLENTFRAINIGLANEIAIMCEKLGINVWEVIDAAATKPFGFMKFSPGPGLGGHCIPVDPHYLSWKLKTLDYDARFIKLASEINTNMPNHVVKLISEALNENQKSINGSKILVIGVAYKRDIDDVRESPAIDVLHLLNDSGAKTAYFDPNVKEIIIGNEKMQSLKEIEIQNLKKYDACTILTDHSNVDYQEIFRHSNIVIDTRNTLPNEKSKNLKRLGQGNRYRKKEISYSLIIPIYNEKRTIDRLLTNLEKFKNQFEIIIIDDGSTDGTEELLRNVDYIKYIKNKCNAGKGISISKGTEFATKRNIILIDGDLEIELSEINKLTEKFESYDFQCAIVGVRWKKV